VVRAGVAAQLAARLAGKLGAAMRGAFDVAVDWLAEWWGFLLGGAVALGLIFLMAWAQLSDEQDCIDQCVSAKVHATRERCVYACKYERPKHTTTVVPVYMPVSR